MTLDQLPAGSRVFIDSNIFIYHFTAASDECRRLLERCERRELRGVTSVVVLAEVTHRLMMIEAVGRNLVSGTNLVKKLRASPEVVKQLAVYQEQAERIPLMGIEVVRLELADLLRAGAVRQRHGMLTNDSLLVTAAAGLAIRAIASADIDLARDERVDLYRPVDVEVPPARATPLPTPTPG